MMMLVDSLIVWLLDMTEDDREKELTPGLRCAVLIALLGFANFGYGTGVMSGAAPMMDQGMQLKVIELTFIVTATVVFAAVGAGCGGPLSDKYGRKRIICISAFISCTATILCTFAPSVLVLIAARALLGIGIGLNFTVIPMYVAETVNKKRRGRVVDLSDFSVVSGQLISGFANAFASIIFVNKINIAWRLSILFGIIPPFLLFLLVNTNSTVESPRWLIAVGKPTSARLALAKLRGQSNPNIDTELQSIQKAMSGVLSPPSLAKQQRASKQAYKNPSRPKFMHEKSALIPKQIPSTISQKNQAAEEKEKNNNDDSSYSLLQRMSTRRVRRALLLGIGIQVLTQLSGINAAMYYGADICIDAGIPSELSIWISMCLTFAQLIGVKISLSTVDIKGRRFTLLRSLLIVVPCLLSLGIAFSFHTSWLAILALIGYLIGFGSGLSGVGYVVLSEIFPLDVRGICVAVGSVTFWIANSLVAFSFPIVSSLLGPQYCFFFFAFVSAIGFIVLFEYLPETAHQSLEAIDEFFEGAEYPKEEWYSVGFYGVDDVDDDMRDLGPVAASAELVFSGAKEVGSTVVDAATAAAEAIDPIQNTCIKPVCIDNCIDDNASSSILPSREIYDEEIGAENKDNDDQQRSPPPLTAPLDKHTTSTSSASSD
mmetsp:Transcript_5851/g.8656  ORF Transcript_5851/g.8656 Transcript_5851/m.8656 type:complete len:657 (-) Transcript_5851:244-2214(-)